MGIKISDVYLKEGFDGVRVTRKQITFYLSHEASERLQQMADNAGIFKWEMASRMILKGLPGILSSGYASPRNPEAINRYEWMFYTLNLYSKGFTIAVARRISE